MRPITQKQWQKMSARSRDWLVVKALGFFVKVFWHVEVDGKIVSGSYDSEAFATAVRNHKPNKFPKRAMVHRSLCYWCVSTVPNCAQEVIAEMNRRGWNCQLNLGVDGKKVAQFYKGWGDRCKSDFYECASIEEAICNAALQTLGLLEKYPF